MLHRRQDTDTIKVSDLDAIFNGMCKTQGHSWNGDVKVVDLIVEQADACSNESGALKLENKIVLAIGIRLEAERFVIAKIKDDAFVNAITGTQTRVLIDRFKRDFPTDDKSIGILDRVELMTPENIHVNSFMYEPIIDMADDHLRRLYKDVKTLA